MQRQVCATTQRETKLLLVADNQEETAELTLPLGDFSDYADKIKAYRKKHKLTQEELARVMSVKHLTLRAWEQKKRKTAISYMAAA